MFSSFLVRTAEAPHLSGIPNPFWLAAVPALCSGLWTYSSYVSPTFCFHNWISPVLPSLLLLVATILSSSSVYLYILGSINKWYHMLFFSMAPLACFLSSTMLWEDLLNFISFISSLRISYNVVLIIFTLSPNSAQTHPPLFPIAYQVLSAPSIFS